MPETRWRRRKDARPAEILHAALACFAERGFAACKLDDVAARAGVTKGTLYLYFPNKEELFKAVVRTELLPNLDKLEEKLADEKMSASESMRWLISFWTKTIIGSSLAALPKIVISEVGNFPELAEFYSQEVIARVFRMIGGILRRGVEKGEFRSDINIEDTVSCVIAPVLFSMLYKHSLEPHSGRKLDTDSLFKTHAEILLRGLANEPERTAIKNNQSER